MFVGQEQFEVKLRFILFKIRSCPLRVADSERPVSPILELFLQPYRGSSACKLISTMQEEKSYAPTSAQGEKRAVINLTDDPQHLIDILSARHPQQFIHLLRKMWVEYTCSEYREMDKHDFHEEILVFQDSMQFFNELDSYLKNQTSDLE